MLKQRTRLYQARGVTSLRNKGIAMAYRMLRYKWPHMRRVMTPVCGSNQAAANSMKEWREGIKLPVYRRWWRGGMVLAH